MTRSSESAASEPRQGDAGTVAAAGEILSGQSRRRGFARLLPFLGPAFIASVAYMDPGNFATNIQAGAKFGYLLLWVVVASNLMAMLIQSLSAKLGIATGRNLAEHCREHFPTLGRLGHVGPDGIVAMATDLAEFLGAAIGFNLLFGIPLWIAGILTAVATFLILGLERYGFRPLEAVITALVGVIALCYWSRPSSARPDWGAGRHRPRPQRCRTPRRAPGPGILGATVMPHVIFLHSALMQGRVVAKDPARCAGCSASKCST